MSPLSPLSAVESNSLSLDGAFHIPSHVSEGARHLLKRMLHTDPLRRATITEIRSMPFFQEDLPRYLQPLPEVEQYC